ncbi:hypothetical protein [Mesorhizobium sp.]|nr:hypothetical protein [Mesorhizobium sp.]
MRRRLEKDPAKPELIKTSAALNICTQGGE